MRSAALRDGALLTLVALALRSWGLGAQSLWLDEVLQVRMSGLPVGDMIHRILAGGDNSPPLYHLLLHLVLRSGGETEAWVRGLSVLFGTAAIPLLYVLVRELAEERTARIAALLLALSPLHIWYSQEARMYALAVTLVLAATLALVRARRAPSLGAWVVYTLLAAAALYTYLYVAFALLAHGCWLLSGRETRRLLRPWLVSQGVAVVLFLPWAAAFVQRPEFSAGLEKHINPVLSLGYTLVTFLGGYSIGPSVGQLHVLHGWGGLRPHLPLLAVYGAAGLSTALLALWQWRAAGRLLPLTLCMLAACLLGPLVVSALLPGVTYNVRYALLALPFFLMVLASGATSCGRQAAVAITALLVLLSGYAAVRGHTLPVYFKEDNRAAARYVAARVRPDDGVLLETPEPFRYYFRDREATTYDLPRGLKTAELEREVAPLIARQRRVWLVECRGWTVDPTGALPAHLERSLEQVGVPAEFPGVRVIGYRRRVAEDGSALPADRQ